MNNLPQDHHNYHQEAVKIKKSLSLNKLILGASMMVLLITGYLFFLNINKQDVDVNNIVIDARFIKRNEEISSLISQVIKTRLDTLATISAQYAQEDEVRSLIQNKRWEKAPFRLRRMFDDFNNNLNAQLFRIFLTDQTGMIQVAFNRDGETKGGYSDFNKDFLNYLLSSQINITNAYRDTIYDNIVFDMITPVKIDNVENNRELIGGLISNLKTDTFQNWIDGLNISIGEGSQVFIVDKIGQLIAHSNSSLLQSDEIINLSGEPDVKRLLTTGGAGSSLIVSSFWGGRKFLSSFQPIQDYGWGLIFRVLFEDLYLKQ